MNMAKLEQKRICSLKKTGRTLAEAQEIAKRKIYKYILALQIIYAKRIGSLYNSPFDSDLIEMTLEDSDDSSLYFEQQDDLKRSFCIHSSIFRKFTLVRHEGGTRVPITPIMDELSGLLRTKSYNKNNTSSYKVGEYSKMYIFNEKAFYEICQEWQSSESYNPKFDLQSEYYSEIIDELTKHFNLKFFDFNKFKYRKDHSNESVSNNILS